VKVLILGGSRFVGRRLARELLEDGSHQVAVFTRGRADDGLGPGVERLRGDRRSAADVRAIAEGRSFDVVYDFLSYDARDARLAIEAFDGRTARFVHISTCSVYWCAGEFPCPVEEDDYARLDAARERPSSIEYAYGSGKRGAEDELRRAREATGFPVTVIRMPIVAGEEDASLRYAGYVQRVAGGGPLVLPDGGHAPFRHVYVADVTRALRSLAASATGVGEAYNLAGGEILTLRRVVDGIARLMGCEPERVAIPAARARRAAGDAYATLFPFSQEAAQVPSIRKARRDLAWEPTPWETWLERSVRWAQRHLESGGAPPPASEHRALEIALAGRWRDAMLSFDAEAWTSSEPPG